MPRTKVVPVVPEGDNNITPSKKQISPAKAWIFTWNNYLVPEVPKLESVLSSLGEWGYGYEVAPSTGTKHLQGWVNFSTKLRPTGLNGTGAVKGFENCEKINWIKMKGSIEQNIEYCSKCEDYHTNKKEVVEWKPDDYMDGLELYPWQQEIKDIISGKPDARKIFWFWEPEGNVGKSVFCRHLHLKHEAIIVSGGHKDMAYILSTSSPENIKLIVMDIPRTQEGHISYSFIEEAKNGMIVSGKYESKTVVFNRPHLIILANFEPSFEDKIKLSLDRWVIKRI